MRVARILISAAREVRRLRRDLAAARVHARQLEEENRGLRATVVALRPEWWV